MSVVEMTEMFVAEWILIANPETDDTLEVLKGDLLCHSKDRDEVYRQAVALRPKRYAVLFTGKMPENTAVVL